MTQQFMVYTAVYNFKEVTAAGQEIVQLGLAASHYGWAQYWYRRESGKDLLICSKEVNQHFSKVKLNMFFCNL